MLQQKQQFKDRQLEERQRGRDALARGGAFFLERAALFRAEILQTQVDRADLRRRALGELRALGTDRTAVHPHAAAREHVKEHPAPVVAPRQHGVRALDALAVDADVGRACAPDQVFPMRHVDGVAPEAGRGPGLGLIAGGEHRADAAQHDQQRQRDQQIFRDGKDIRERQVHMRSPPFGKSQNNLFSIPQNRHIDNRRDGGRQNRAAAQPCFVYSLSMMARTVSAGVPSLEILKSAKRS